MSAESRVELDKNAPLTGGVPVGKTRLQRMRWPLMSLAAIAVLGGVTPHVRIRRLFCPCR